MMYANKLHWQEQTNTIQHDVWPDKDDQMDLYPMSSIIVPYMLKQFTSKKPIWKMHWKQLEHHPRLQTPFWTPHPGQPLTLDKTLPND